MSMLGGLAEGGFGSSLGLKVASAMVGLAGDFVTAQASANMAEATSKSAVADYENKMSLERLRLRQEAEANAKEKENMAIERRQKVGQAQASSSATGMALDSLMYEFNRQEARYGATLLKDLQWKTEQANANAQSYYSQAQSRVESAKASVKSFGPINILGAGVGIMGGAMDSYREFVLPNK